MKINEIISLEKVEGEMVEVFMGEDSIGTFNKADDLDYIMEVLKDFGYDEDDLDWVA
jgi:hypothetical protein